MGKIFLFAFLLSLLAYAAPSPAIYSASAPLTLTNGAFGVQSSPSFSGTPSATSFRATGATASTLTVFDASKNLTSLANGSNGQILTMVSGSAAWAAATSTIAWGSITGTLSNQTDLASALALKSPLASPTFTGTVNLPSGSVSSSAWSTGSSSLTVNGVTFASKAPLASPTFTGTVTMPVGAGIGHYDSGGVLSSSAVNLANSDVTGNLGVSHLNSGTSASSSTFWRGDGTWASVSAGAVAWGDISGTLSAQTDLNTALGLKAPLASPTFTTYIKLGSVLTMTDGSDRVQFNAPTGVYEFYANGNLRLYIADSSPQVTINAADQWFENNSAGGPGSITWLTAGVSDIGYNSVQQMFLPGFHQARHIALANTLYFVAPSDSASATLGSNLARITFNQGTIAGNNKELAVNAVQAFKIYDNGGDNYVEMYTGGSGLKLIQTNLNFRMNSDGTVGKLIIGNAGAGANGKRLETVTLSGGTVTKSNTSITANSVLLISNSSLSGAALSPAYSYVITAGTGYVITSSDVTDTSVLKVFVIENGGNG